MAASDAPADVDVERSESDAAAGSPNNPMEDVETCSALAEESGEPCENPAILGTGRCHTHLDFTELPAADSSDEVEAEPYRRRTPTAGMSPSREQGGSEQ